MPLTIIRNDITKLGVDAIVNAANTALQRGGGVCGAIFEAAGADELQAACDRLAPIETGEAVITPGFRLPARFIIHTAGPVYKDGTHGERERLFSCYASSLALAAENDCESIAFPLISSGIFAYPRREALDVATEAINAFLDETDLDVTLVVFDKETLAVSEELLGEIESYIDENYVEEHALTERTRFESAGAQTSFTESAAPARRKPAGDLADIIIGRINARRSPLADAAQSAALPSLEEMVGNLDESFSATLLRLIDASGKKDAEIYRRANIDRRLFSKIRSNEYYSPSKPTVIAFAIALELTAEQTDNLLKRAGFTLTRSRRFDVIVEYFIRNRKYDIYEINEVLFSYDQPLLGG